jgi:hypothetical protein
MAKKVTREAGGLEFESSQLHVLHAFFLLWVVEFFLVWVVDLVPVAVLNYPAFSTGQLVEPSHRYK